MKATTTRQHKDQEQVTIITVTLPTGQTQEFVRFDESDGRVEVETGTYTAEQFSVGLDKMRSAGAQVVETVGYAWGK